MQELLGRNSIYLLATKDRNYSMQADWARVQEKAGEYTIAVAHEIISL